jgi:hypothetical protein
VVKEEDSQLSGCGFESWSCLLDGVSEASYYIGKREIKVSEWGTTNKKKKKKWNHKSILSAEAEVQRLEEKKRR